MKKNLAAVLFIVVMILLTLILTIQKRYFAPVSPEIYISSGTVASGDILFNLIKEAGINNRDASNIIIALMRKYDVRSIRPGNIYEIHHTSFGTVLDFKYWIKPIEYFEVTNTTFGWITQRHLVPSETEIIVTSGIIEQTLWNAMFQKGFSPETILNFTDIFAWQVDFLTETRPNDTFKIVYERYKYKNGVTVDGQIIAAEYVSRISLRHRGVFFKSTDGNISDFYALDGSSLQKLFLRAPLSYRRISSGFTMRRFHPILRYVRPHMGIDYSARAGTQVVSIGNGTVTFAGWNGGFGKQIIIRHNSTYTTMYGHMLKFAKGIRKGVRIKQGQLIGYVGSTGLSTGPHLDFRIKQSGRYVNFLKLKFPPAEKVPKKYRQEFLASREKSIALLEGR
ncbi:MAG: M23 family metallopeptidase [Elusimicrobiota bacterium]